MNRLSAIYSKFKRTILSLLLTPFYKPRSVRELGSDEKAQSLNQFKIKVALGDTSYWTYCLKNGRLYTDRTLSIAVIDEKRSLIKDASWQYDNGRAVEPIKNIVFSTIDSVPKRIEGTVLSLLTGGGGNANYGHWLLDAVPRIAILRKSGILKDVDYYLAPSMHLPFQVESLKYLGIFEKSISSEACRHIIADQIITTDHPRPTLHIPPWICSFLKDSFLDFADARMKPFDKIYITRKDAHGKREIKNEQDVVDALIPRGFHPITNSEYTFSQQIAIFKNAKIVISPQGAGLANIVFSSPQTKVIEIFNKNFRLEFYENLSRSAGLDYTPFVCEKVDKEDDPMSDMYVDVSKLISLL